MWILFSVEILPVTESGKTARLAEKSHFDAESTQN
jgi:hypothetical protein